MFDASQEQLTGVRPFRMAIPWVDSPFFEQLLESADLPSEEKAMLRSFAENGYLVIDPEIPHEWIDRAREDLDRLFSEGGSERPSRIQDGWQHSEAVRRIAAAPRVLKLLELLYRREPIPFQTLNFKVGTQQRAHSDSIHFQSLPAGYMCGVWVAFEEIDADNGPLCYYVGSHKLPYYDMVDLGLPTNHAVGYKGYEDFVESLFALKRYERHELRLKKGQGIIWAANLFHGGSPIRDPQRSRWSQVTHFYFANCMYYTPMLSDTFLGKTHFRRSELIDIRTGESIPHYYQGNPVNPDDCFIHEPVPEPPLWRKLISPITSRMRRSLALVRTGLAGQRRAR